MPHLLGVVAMAVMVEVMKMMVMVEMMKMMVEVMKKMVEVMKKMVVEVMKKMMVEVMKKTMMMVEVVITVSALMAAHLLYSRSTSQLIKSFQLPAGRLPHQ